MTAAHTQRPNAFIVGSQNDDTGNFGSVSVKCPWCRGVHKHSLRSTTDYAHPWCGTPGVVYQLIWPVDPSGSADV
jgi:hypothetical protein